MLFAISGPSSSGKTTLLKALKESGELVFDRQYARELMNLLYISVHDITSSLERIMDFHNRLFDYKLEKERSLLYHDGPIFVERTFLDFLVYYAFEAEALIESRFINNITHINKPFVYNSDLDHIFEEIIWKFSKKCVSATYSTYTSVIYLENIPKLEDDGVRLIDGIERQNELFNAVFMKYFTNEKMFYLSEIDLDKRVEFIKELVRTES